MAAGRVRSAVYSDTLRLRAFALVLCLALPAKADDRGAAGLRADLERIVTSEESSGWFLDRSHYQAIAPTVLVSVCHASLEARRVALDRLVAESEAAGDPRVLFEKEGRVTSRVKDALHVERMRVALENAMKETCPFWVTPAPGYDGRQTDRNRFTLNLETGALLQGRVAASEATIGATYTLRLLAGWGFRGVGLLAGAEMTGGPRTNGEEPGLVMNYFPAIPVVLRILHVNWMTTLESGLVTVFHGDDTRLQYGVRGGGGVGLMGLRTRHFIPWFGLAAYYEYFFPKDEMPAAHLVRAGVRLGIIYDP